MIAVLLSLVAAYKVASEVPSRTVYEVEITTTKTPCTTTTPVATKTPCTTPVPTTTKTPCTTATPIVTAKPYATPIVTAKPYATPKPRPVPTATPCETALPVQETAPAAYGEEEYPSEIPSTESPESTYGVYSSANSISSSLGFLMIALAL